MWLQQCSHRAATKVAFEQYIFRDKQRKNISGAQALSNSNQKYLAFIKISPNMAAKLYEPLMEFSENPINGVKLEEAYQVFGEWDFAVLFQADSNANALHFVGDKIRLVEGVLETFTVPLTPVKDYRK